MDSLVNWWEPPRPLQPQPAQRRFNQVDDNRDSGVKAAETGESHALGRKGCAKDGTLGVAQYVDHTLQGQDSPVNIS